MPLFQKNILLSVLFCCFAILPGWSQTAKQSNIAATANQFRQSRVIDSVSMYAFAGECLAAGTIERFMEAYDTACSYTGAWSQKASDVVFLEQMDSIMNKKQQPPQLTAYRIHFYLADIYGYQLQNASFALKHNEQSVAIAKTLNDSCRIIEALIVKNRIYADVLHNNLDAGITLNEVDKIARSMGYKKLCTCDAAYELEYAMLYNRLGNYDMAITYAEKSIKRFTDKTEHGTRSQNGRLYYSNYLKAQLEIKVAGFDAAQQSIGTAETFARTAPDPRLMLNALNGLRFIIWQMKGDYKKADSIALHIDYRLMDEASRASITYMYHLVLLRIGQHQLTEAEQTLADFEKMHNPDLLQFRVYLYELKYLLEKANNNPSQALAYAETYHKLKDSLNNNTMQLAAIGAQIRYQTNLKEQQLQVQQAELKNSRQNVRIAFIASGATILLLLLLVTYKNYRNIREKNNLTQTFSRQLIDSRELERNRLANEMHDGIGQELSLIRNSLEARKDSHHAAMLADSIENVRAISRNLFPALLESIGLKIALEQLLNQIDQQFEIYVVSEIDYTHKLDQYAELQLFRIVQEATNNTLKYARAKSIKVSVKETRNQLLLTIMDNGIGFSLSEALKKKQGIGLMSMQQRANAIDAGFQIHSEPDKGTTITLKLDLT
jgi:signal transduction histidine kinase